MAIESKYSKRGVSSTKEDVHAAIKNIDKGLYPKAFCKIVPDILGGDKDYCNIMHSDGAGTKSSLAYIYWKETGDLSVWKGIAQDAIVMNLDDLLCVGAYDNIFCHQLSGAIKTKYPERLFLLLSMEPKRCLKNSEILGSVYGQPEERLLIWVILSEQLLSIRQLLPG